LAPFQMVMLSILPWYLGGVQSIIWQMNFNIDANAKSKDVKKMLALYDKMAAPLLFLHFSIVALLCYSAFEGVYSIVQIIIALIHTPFLIINAHGYFNSAVWRSCLLSHMQSKPFGDLDYNLAFAFEMFCYVYSIIVPSLVVFTFGFMVWNIFMA
ncbi:hypothetical protein PENTCL1PPCAC_27141, partial [Pristionchus entomophagus]